jgi:STE24 endopeptidase
MNLAVAFVIIIYFFVSEFSAPQAIEDPWTRVCVMLLLLLAVPLAALFQTRVLTNRYQTESISHRQHTLLQTRMSIAHTVVWICASLAMLFGVRWHDVVRSCWQLDRWPILDELLILAPALTGLVMSWAIFYEIEKRFVEQLRNSKQASETPDETLERNRENLFVALTRDWKARLAYVSIRFRVHVLMLLVPLLILALARDLIPSGPPERVFSFGIAFGIVFAACYPFLLLYIWKTKRLDDLNLEAELRELCQTHRMGVCMIRVWKTNHQVLNAAIAGLIPGLRVLILTDGMLLKFSPDELKAIVRHEAGHIRRHHFPRRIAAVMLPLLLLFFDQQSVFGVHAMLEQQLVAAGQPASCSVGIISCFYILYLWFVSRWLFRKMEFEADFYSVGNRKQLSDENKAHAVALISALQKFAVYSPEHFDKGSGLHPPLRNRIARIAELT